MSKIITFKHSGNLGDIIYALPSIKSLCIKRGALAGLHLKLGVPSGFTDKTHPVGAVQLDQKMFEMGGRLLAAQPYIKYVTVYNEGQEQAIDYDLDLFRKEYKNLSAGCIQSWYSNAYPELRPNLFEQSLFIRQSPNDMIIVNRTSRYNNVLIDYSTLRKYDNVFFVGVESEFKTISLHNRNIQHLKVRDFLELATYIASCRLFIGNQSMAFAIAEQLKVRRILEQYIPAPNVIPHGGEYYVTHTNDQFQNAIKLCLDGKTSHTDQAESEAGAGPEEQPAQENRQ